MQERYFPDFFSKKDKVLRWLSRRVLTRDADKIICESSFVKRDIINFIPLKFPSKKLPVMKVYPSQNKKKPVARVALLTGCVQKVLSPQINESTIRLLNRHNIEVFVLKNIECCGSLDHHLGKSDRAKNTFRKNISIWYDEYINKGLDAIISNSAVLVVPGWISPII